MAAPVIPIAENIYRIPTMGSAINSFLFIENDSSLTLIDTGIPSAPAKISEALKFLKQDVSNIKNLIFTHSHDDHAGGGAKMIELIGSPTVLAHEKEIEYLESGKNPPRDLSHLAGLFFRFMPEGGFQKISVTRGLTDGEVLPLGGGLKIIHTPGHTPGHVVLAEEERRHVFVGDCLFAGSIGRTDLPGGNHLQLINSIKSLILPLGDDFIVHSGHGPDTTIGRERRTNPFLS